MVCDVLKKIAIEAFQSCVESLVKSQKNEENDDNIFSQCYDYLYNFHQKYHKELKFDDIRKLSKDPKNNIDKITVSMLSLYKDSYVKYIQNESSVKENDNINNLDLEEEVLNSEDEKIKEITKSTENISLNDDKEIESYDEECEKEPEKKTRKRLYNEVQNSIMDSLINFDKKQSIFKAKLKKE